MNRVLQLADRKNGAARKDKPPFHSIIPLKEILAEIYCIGASSKKIAGIYQSLLKKLSSELDILLFLPIEQIRKRGDETLAEAIRRMRNKEIFIEEGFDGQFGKISVFPKKVAKKFH